MARGTCRFGGDSLAVLPHCHHNRWVLLKAHPVCPRCGRKRRAFGGRPHWRRKRSVWAGFPADDRTAVVTDEFWRSGWVPNRAGIVGRRCQRLGGLVFRRLSGDFAHGLMKGQAEDLDKEVAGVAGELPLRPAPAAVFDQQARIWEDSSLYSFRTELR